MMPLTLYEKLWSSHLVREEPDGTALLYIDRHLVHEVTSPQAFEGLEVAHRKPWRIDSVVATADHNVSTAVGRNDREIADPISRLQVDTLDRNIEKFHVKTYFGMKDHRQGIVHVIGPEQGATLPGMTVVCGDSHTSTHGAFAALAFGIGTSEVEHVMATQCLVQKKAKTLLIRAEGKLPTGVTAKDLILAVIGKIGIGGGVGSVLEYGGGAFRALSMEGRMTVSNMSIEAGARAGTVAPDETTFEYLSGRPGAPAGEAWERALVRWRELPSDPGATFDRSIEFDATGVEPMISYGTNPGMVVPIGGHIPEGGDAAFMKALTYMGFEPGEPMAGKQVDMVFVGSCTNSRISDLRAAAEIFRNRKVAHGVRVLVVPGSQQVKHEAEREGLHEIFAAAGAEWRESGCSMCIGMNGDIGAPGQLVVSTSNRNFEGRQGQGVRTLLASPASAAAAAVTGRVTDPRELGGRP
jgi:3-isopropylmalate/(R)-2-methylmalate dehydratase large subunit